MKDWVGICRLGGVGDLLIVSSVLPQFKKQGYAIEFICQSPYEPVLVNNPHIDKLTVKDPGDLPPDPQEWKKWFRLRAKEFDGRFYHLSGSIENLLALSWQHYAFDWPASYRRKLCGASYLATVHDICEVPHEYAPNYFPTDQEVAAAAETKASLAGSRRVIGWVIAGSRIDKIHPYSALAISRLIKELGAVVIMFGAPTEREQTSAQAIHDQVVRTNGSATDLHLAMSPGPHQPSWPLRRSLGLLQQCDLVIGPDTGPMWAVAMQPMPKIMLLGHASVLNIVHGWWNTVALSADPIRVPCWPCHKLHDSPETCVPDALGVAAACMADISTESIVETAKQLWEPRHVDVAETDHIGARARNNGSRPRARHPREDHARRTHPRKRSPGNGLVPTGAA